MSKSGNAKPGSAKPGSADVLVGMNSKEANEDVGAPRIVGMKSIDANEDVGAPRKDHHHFHSHGL